jgi:hypothetical protein
MCLIQFLSLLHVRRKPCTYLASRLTLSPKRLNQLPFDPRHLEVPLGAAKKISMPWYIRQKPCTYLVPRLTQSPNGLKRASN